MNNPNIRFTSSYFSYVPSLRELIAILPETPPFRTLPTPKYLKANEEPLMIVEISDRLLTVYRNGFFSYSDKDHTTVQSIRMCMKPIKYESVIEKSEHLIEDSMFMDLPFYIRLMEEGENRLEQNLSCYYSKKTITFDNVPYESIDLKDPESDFVEKYIEEKTKAEQLSMLATAMKHLTDRQRLVIKLYYFNNMTQQQIADNLNCSKQSVNESLKGAIKKLGGAFNI